MSFVDEVTLKELKILRRDSPTDSLVEVLDRTVTTEGKQNLINHLNHPLASKEEIVSFHRLIKSIHLKLDMWIPFQELLKSNLFVKVRQLKDQQLIYDKPLFSKIFIKKRESGKDQMVQFLLRLSEITQSILSFDKHPGILDELQKYLVHFQLLMVKQKNYKYANWFCLNVKYKELSRLLEILFQIDALISMAKVHGEMKLVFPKWNDVNEPLEIQGLRNLIIRNPVPNDLILEQHKRRIFLTGPNMAGKSTFLIALGHLFYLARCGLGVPAVSAKIPWIDVLFTAFESSTVISKGLSFFGSEVERSVEAKKLISTNSKVLILADELYKGTNVVDSHDCLKYFAEKVETESTLAFFATHLTDCVASFNDSVTEKLYFEGEQAGNTITFNYILNKGISFQKLGLVMLRERWRDSSSRA